MSNISKGAEKGTPIGENTVAVVTGASGGLGRGFIKALKKRGATIIATDIKKVEIEGVTFHVLDVTKHDAVQALAKKIKPNLWINNAGLLGAGECLSIPQETIESVISVNLLGVVNGTRCAAEVMAENGGGAILNVGSLASYAPTPGLSIYSATKFGVRGYTFAVLSELRERGVKLSLLCPDGILTPMLEAEVDNPAAAMPFSGGKLLDPFEVSEFGVRLVEQGKIYGMVPFQRGILSRIAGEFPGLVMKTGKSLFNQGVKVQQRYSEQLKSK